MPDFSDIRLLVVDDEAALRNLLAEVLKDDGFNVRTADSGEQALALFEAEAADIVLSDMSMPGMSGIDLLKKVKDIRGELVEFVIITANATLDTAISATRHGATDYLRKPVEDIGDISRLAARLAQRIRERREKDKMMSGLMDLARTLVAPPGDPFLVRTDAAIEQIVVSPEGLTLGPNATGAAKVPLEAGLEIKIVRQGPDVAINTAGAPGDVKLLRIDGVPAKEAVLHGGEHISISGAEFRFVNPRRLPDGDKLLSSAAKLFGADSDGVRKEDGSVKLSGKLEEIGLPNLLQMMNLLNKTGVLQVKEDSGGSGEIHLVNGEMLHARLVPVEGKKAVQRMLAWPKGEFTFEAKTSPPAARTIEERSQTLLLDGMRLVDELKSLGKSAPPRTLRLAVAHRPSDVTSEERQVLEAVSRFGLVGTILDRSQVPDVEILRALIRFRKEGAITVVATATGT